MFGTSGVQISPSASILLFRFSGLLEVNYPTLKGGVFPLRPLHPRKIKHHQKPHFLEKPFYGIISPSALYHETRETPGYSTGARYDPARSLHHRTNRIGIGPILQNGYP